MNAFIKSLARAHPDRATAFTVGYSFEGRLIQGLKVGVRSCTGGSSKSVSPCEVGKAPPGGPVVWLGAGTHAREWIAPAAALYFINQVSRPPPGR